MSDQNRSLISWAAQKKTSRDLLSIAVLLRGWSPAQNRDAGEETILSEADYDSAVADATSAKEAAQKSGGRKPITLVHPKLLLAIVCRRCSPAEADSIIATQQDDTIGDREKKKHLVESIARQITWPPVGIEAREVLSVDYPIAWSEVFPSLYLRQLGLPSGEAVRQGD